MKSRIHIIIFLFLCLCASTAHASFAFRIGNDEKIVIGIREDYYVTKSIINSRAATSKNFGIITFGFSENGDRARCGLNDHGLLYNVLSVTPKKSRPRKGSFVREGYMATVAEEMLLHCSTVQEAVAFLNKYNFEAITDMQIFLADKAGHSAVVEPDTTTSCDYWLNHVSNERPSITGPGTEIVSPERTSIQKNEEEGLKLLQGAEIIPGDQWQTKTGNEQYAFTYAPVEDRLSICLYGNFNEVVKLKPSELFGENLNDKPLSDYFKNKSIYLQADRSYEIATHLTNQITRYTTIAQLTQYLDTINKLPYYPVSEYVNVMLSAGIRHAQNKKTKTAQAILDLYHQRDLHSADEMAEYLTAYIEINNGDNATAKARLEKLLQKYPENVSVAELLKKIR